MRTEMRMINLSHTLSSTLSGHDQRDTARHTVAHMDLSWGPAGYRQPEVSLKLGEQRDTASQSCH